LSSCLRPKLPHLYLLNNEGLALTCNCFQNCLRNNIKRRSALAISFELVCIFCIIGEYGELGSCAFLTMTIAFEKLVLMNLGSINTTLMPN
jgi:hypothetical protein